MSFLDIFETIVSCLSPIIIAWCGWRITISERETKQYRELRDKYEQTVEEQRQKDREEQRELLDKQAERLQKLTAEVEALQEAQRNSHIGEQISKLLQMTNMNFAYCQSLSTVVTSIGESLIRSDQFTDVEAIETAINQHHKEEQELIQQIYKIKY